MGFTIQAAASQEQSLGGGSALAAARAQGNGGKALHSLACRPARWPSVLPTSVPSDSRSPLSRVEGRKFMMTDRPAG